MFWPGGGDALANIVSARILVCQLEIGAVSVDCFIQGLVGCMICMDNRLPLVH
jgi:hypothetical protein